MSRSSQHITNLTVQNIYPINADNSFVPALKTLTSDGVGGSYWAVPSSLGGYPSFNSVVADNVAIPALVSTNTLYLSSATGIGMAVAPSANRIDIFSKSFGAFAVSTGNTLVAYSNAVVTPTVNLIGTSGIRIDANPLTQTLTFSGMPTAISTGQYGYNQINVISNASQLNGKTYLTASSPSSILIMMGTGDILLSTNVTTNTVTASISSFTSAGYLATSSLAGNAYLCTLSTVSTLFYDIPRAVSTTTGLLTVMSNMSTGIRAQLTFDEQNLQNNYTVLANFQNYSTGIAARQLSQDILTNKLLGNTLSSFYFRSSIGTTLAANTIQSGFTNATSTLFQCSTVSFRLDSMSSMTKYMPVTQITYTPSLWFSYVNSDGTHNSTRDMRYISTCLYVGTSILSNVTFTRPWQALNTDTQTSNLYADTVTLTIPADQVSTNIRSTFTLGHAISPFCPMTGATRYGIQSLNYQNSSDITNSLSVVLAATVPQPLV
jgi:hypothetical protein